MADDKRVSVIFSVKNDEFNRNLAETKQQIKLTQSELQLAGQKIQTYGNNLKNLGEKQKTLTTQIKNVKDQMKLYSDSISKNKTKLEENRKALEQLGNKKKQINQQYKEAVKTYGEESEQAQTLKTQLDAVKEEYTEMSNRVKNNVKAINNHSTALNQSETQLTRLQGELNNVNNEIARNGNGFLNAGKTFESASKKLTTFGSVATGIGNKLLTLSAPFIAFGTYASKVGIDFEKAMDTVQATSQASSEDMEKLTAKAKEMGANTSKSAKDSADALNYMALAGWKTQEMLDGIEPILKASVAYNADLGTTSDLATDSLSALGLSAKDLGKYLDIVSNAQSNSNTTGTALMEAYIGVGGTFKNLNTSLEESSTLLGTMANRGIKGSEAGTTLNSILINLTKKSGESAEALEKLGVSAFDSEGKFKGITVVLRELNEKFKGMTEEQQTVYKSMIAGKTQITGFNALLSGLDEEYDSLYQKQSNCNGALEKMYETMSDNTQGKIDSFKSKLEALGIQMADNLLPHINSLLDKLMNLIDWFSNLDEGTQKTIINFGLMTVATGGLLKVIGGVATGAGQLVGAFGKISTKLGTLTTSTTGVGSVLTKLTATFGTVGGAIIPIVATVGTLSAAIYGTHEYLDAMNNTATKSAEEMSSLEKAFTEMSGVTVYTREELEKMGLVQEELSDNLSKDFKEAVNTATKNVQEFRFELQKVKIDGVITKDECVELQNRVDELCNSALETINNRKEEIQNTLGEAFNTDGVLTQDEKVILEFYNQTFDKNKEEIEKMQGTINELLRKVREEGYVLTDADESMIRNYYAEIQRLELEAQATNNYEIEFEKNKFKERARNLDLEEAETLLKDRRKYYDDEIAERSAYYDTSIQMIESKMGDMNEKQRESAEKDILDLKNAKDKEIDTLQGYYNEEYEALIKQNANLENELDRYSGEAKETRDKRCEQELNDMLALYDGINEITESGLIQMYNTSTQSYENLYAEVDQTTGKIIGCSKYWADESGIHATEVTGANEKVKDSMNSLTSKAQSSFNQMAQDLKDNTKTTIDENNKQIISNGEVVGSYDKITDAGNGLRQCVTNINGTPCKITINKDGVITSVDIVEDKLNQLIKKDRTIDVKVKYTDYYSDGRGNVYYGGKWVSGGYATGGTSNYNQIATTNEVGWELHDSITNMARSIGNNLSYLPSGTRVTNHLASTLQMQEDIRKEVSKQLSKNTKEESIINNVTVGGTEISINGNLDNISLEELNSILNQNNINLKNSIYKELDKVSKKY